MLGCLVCTSPREMSTVAAVVTRLLASLRYCMVPPAMPSREPALAPRPAGAQGPGRLPTSTLCDVARCPSCNQHHGA